jgi:long-chain acyl-CoA synthetase
MADWAKAKGKGSNLAALRDDAEFLRALNAAVDRVNAELSVVEKVRRFILADEPFTVENEQLTPSIKIRRHVLREAYGERLDALYKR